MVSDADRLAKIGDQMRRARKRVRMTQQDLADAVGMSRENIASIETARNSLRAVDLQTMAIALKVSVAWLLGEESEADMLEPTLAAAWRHMPERKQRLLVQLAQDMADMDTSD